MSLTRRTILTALAGSIATHPWWSTQAHAGEADVWHVVYRGTHSEADAAELRDVIGLHLGSEVASSLRLMRRGPDWVVVYDRSEVRNPHDAAIAAAVATRHDTLLRRALELDATIAEPIRAADLSATWDVQYGDPAPVDAVTSRFDRVAAVLGPGVAKSLVVLPLPDGRAILVWRRQGDAPRTREIAAHHSRLLAADGLAAVAVPSPAGLPTQDASTRAPESPQDLRPVQPLPDLPRVDDLPALPPEPDDTGTSDTDHSVELLDTGVEEPTPPEPEPEPEPEPRQPPPAARVTPLEDEIEAFVKSWRARGRLEPIERTAWIVHDLRADTTLADINADVPMQAASMIKPWVGAAFLHQVQHGAFQYGPRSRAHMEKMIQISDNASTNWMLRTLGGPAATERILKRAYPHLCRSLRLVEFIPGDGRTYLNRVSVRDHQRLLRALWRRELPHSNELLRVMHLPSSDRIFQRVPNIPAGTAVYDKTGTTAMCCGDMGILVAQSATPGAFTLPYIIVGVVERSSRAEAFTSWVRSRADLIRGVSGVTYDWLKLRHGLA